MRRPLLCSRRAQPPLDVTNYDAIPGVVAVTEKAHGPIDVLADNAGYGHEGVLEESSLDDQIETSTTKNTRKRLPTILEIFFN